MRRRFTARRRRLSGFTKEILGHIELALWFPYNPSIPLTYVFFLVSFVS